MTDDNKNRFAREVRAKTHEILGEKNCSYCFKPKPIATLKKIKNGRHICPVCAANRDKAMKGIRK
jgi:formylmethanofuran dehydrogenase subunit E